MVSFALKSNAWGELIFSLKNGFGKCTSVGIDEPAVSLAEHQIIGLPAEALGHPHGGGGRQEHHGGPGGGGHPGGAGGHPGGAGGHPLVLGRGEANL